MESSKENFLKEEYSYKRPIKKCTDLFSSKTMILQYRTMFLQYRSQHFFNLRIKHWSPAFANIRTHFIPVPCPVVVIYCGDYFKWVISRWLGRKMRRMWLGLEIVEAGLPPLSMQCAHINDLLFNIRVSGLKI